MEFNNNNGISEQNGMNNEPSVFGAEGNPNNSGNTNKSQSKGSKAGFLFVLVIIILLLLGAMGVAFMKSDEQKFFELLTTKQSIIDMGGLVEKSGGKEQTNLALEVNFNEIAEFSGQDLDGDLRIKLDFISLAEKDNAYGTVAAKINDESIITLEYAKTGEIYGIKLDDTTENFVAIENDNLKDLCEKFGIEDTKQIPNKLLTQDDYKEVMKMDSEAFKKILNRYIGKIAHNIKVEKESNVKMEFGDREVTTTKYTWNFTMKEYMDIMREIVKELKDDDESIELVINDLKAIINLMEENEYPLEVSADDIPTVSEIREKIEEVYEDIEESYANEEFKEYLEEEGDESVLVISVYEYNGKNIATEFEENMYGGNSVIFKCLNDKDLYIALEAKTSDDVEGVFALEGTINDRDIEADFVIKSNGKELKVFTITEEHIKDSKEKLVKLNEDNALILNDATEAEIQDFVNELTEGLQELSEDMVKKLNDVLPASMLSSGENTNNNSNNNINNNTNNSNTNVRNPIINNEVEESDSNTTAETQTGMLSKVQSLYNKINIGDTKQQVIAKIGEPDDTTLIGEYSVEYLYWKDGKNSLVSVRLSDGIVSDKSIELMSNKYYDVYIGKELNATVTDLNIKVSLVKEGMTMQEVKEILGNAVFESKESDIGTTSYTWYDKQEQSLRVQFKDGKVWYVGMVI